MYTNNLQIKTKANAILESSAMMMNRTRRNLKPVRSKHISKQTWKKMYDSRSLIPNEQHQTRGKAITVTLGMIGAMLVIIILITMMPKRTPDPIIENIAINNNEQLEEYVNIDDPYGRIAPLPDPKPVRLLMTIDPVIEELDPILPEETELETLPDDDIIIEEEDTLEEVIEVIEIEEVETLPVVNKPPVVRERVYSASMVYYDVPLDDELQEFLYQQCELRDVPMELALAVIWKESQWDPNAISATNDYGLMQINHGNHGWLRRTLSEEGVDDFLDPYDNVIAGTYILGCALDSCNGDWNMALMSYNLGGTNASARWSQGQYTSSYSLSVVSLVNQLIVRV